MSEFDVTLTPPPELNLVLEPPAEFGLQLGAEQGHQGIPGEAGGQLTAVAGATLNGHKAVAYGADGRLVHASADNADHLLALAGILEVSAAAGEPVPVRDSGLVEFSGWAWAPGPVLVGLNGQLVQAIPVGAVYVQAIGRGEGTRLFIDVQSPYSLS